MTGFVLPSVKVAENGASACATCGHSLAPAGDAWKSGARCVELTLEAIGAPFDTGQGGVVLRQFVCPTCATLLDTETATARDAPLDDRLAT